MVATLSRALVLHRTILRAAFSAAHIFSWIFIFQYFAFQSRQPEIALARVILLYALTQTTVALVTPLAARLLRRGLRRTLLYALFLAAFGFLSLAMGIEGLLEPTPAILLFALCLGAYRAMYYIPYEAEVRDRAVKKYFWSELVIVVLPISAGMLIAATSAGPVLLLGIAAITVVLSALPLLKVPETYHDFPWSSRDLLGHLVASEHRGIVMHAFLEGVNGAALLLLWPLAIFSLFGFSYGLLGAVITATLLIGLLLRPPVRAIIRRAELHRSPYVRAALVLSPWIARMAVATPLGVLFVDSYFLTTTPLRHGADVTAYEQVSDAGHYLDEFTALKEVALSLGRAALCVIAAAVALAVSPAAAFLFAFALAGVASALAAYKA